MATVQEVIEDIIKCDNDKQCVQGVLQPYFDRLIKQKKTTTGKKKRKASPWNIAVKHCSADIFKDIPIAERMKKCSEWWKPLAQSEKDKIVAKYS